MIAQFQAFVCSKIVGCCSADGEDVRQLVEDSLYGEAFPERRLPMRACVARRGIEQQNRASRCSACEAAVSVSLAVRPEMCIPQLGAGFGQQDGTTSSSAKQFAVQPESLSERCAFVQDAVSAMADRLVPALQDAVCACAGCCEADDAGAAAGASTGTDASAAASSGTSSAAGSLRRVCLFDLPLEEAWQGPLAFLQHGNTASAVAAAFEGDESEL